MGTSAETAVISMLAMNDLIQSAESEIDSADDLNALDTVRVSYLGKKGALTIRLKELSQLPAEERPVAGQEINRAKKEIQQRISASRALRRR